MTTQERLREDAAALDIDIETLTSRIEEAERTITHLRQQRDDARFNRAQCLATADFLDRHGWKVERDRYNNVTVSVEDCTEHAWCIEDAARRRSQSVEADGGPTDG